MEGFIRRVKQWWKEGEDSGAGLVEVEAKKAAGIIAVAIEDTKEMKKKMGAHDKVRFSGKRKKNPFR